MEQLEIMIDNLRKECYASFISTNEKEKIDERIDVIIGRLKEVERRCSDSEEAIDVQKDHLKLHTDDISDLKDRIIQIEGKIRELDSRTDKNERDIQDLFNRLNQLVEKLKELENTLANSNSGDVDELMKKLKELEKLVHDKVDCDLFDNEMAELRALIGNMDDGKPATNITTTAPMARPAGPQLSTKDLNRIKEILEKFPGVEEIQ